MTALLKELFSEAINAGGIHSDILISENSPEKKKPSSQGMLFSKVAQAYYGLSSERDVERFWQGETGSIIQLEQSGPMRYTRNESQYVSCERYSRKPAAGQASFSWDEESHPRVEGGSSEGGQFTGGGGGTPQVSGGMEMPTLRGEKYNPSDEGVKLAQGDEISAYYEPNPQKPSHGTVFMVDDETGMKVGEGRIYDDIEKAKAYAEKALGAELPERTADTMSDAIAMGSPSGKTSKRAKEAAQKKLSEGLFGKGGLKRPKPKQEPKKENMLRRAKQLRELAERGLKPRAYLKEAKRLEAEAAKLEPDSPST